jgi:hypothetical protein
VVGPSVRATPSVLTINGPARAVLYCVRPADRKRNAIRDPGGRRDQAPAADVDLEARTAHIRKSKNESTNAHGKMRPRPM